MKGRITRMTKRKNTHPRSKSVCNGGAEQVSRINNYELAGFVEGIERE